MAKLIEAAGFDLWSTVGTTEPARMQSIIYKGAGTTAGQKRIEKGFKINDSWNLAKLPEFAFCLPLIDRLYPNSRFLWMQRPIEDRVQSHINMGWHLQISERLQKTKSLRTFIEKVTEGEVTDDDQHNDFLYFAALDILTAVHARENPNRYCVVQYNHLNSDFAETMRIVSNFVGVSFWQNIESWRKIKRIPQQSGKWESAQ